MLLRYNQLEILKFHMIYQGRSRFRSAFLVLGFPIKTTAIIYFYSSPWSFFPSIEIAHVTLNSEFPYRYARSLKIELNPLEGFLD